MLKLSLKEFSTFLEKTDWLQKLFLYFDPFSQNYFNNHAEEY